MTTIPLRDGWSIDLLARLVYSAIQQSHPRGNDVEASECLFCRAMAEIWLEEWT
jgi:hypothetical protein